MAVIRDMTRLHQLESEVRRGETMAAVGQMAIGLAHEIRNPLGAIRGAVQLMAREMGEDTRLAEYTDVLLKEGQHQHLAIRLASDQDGAQCRSGAETERAADFLVQEVGRFGLP